MNKKIRFLSGLSTGVAVSSLLGILIIINLISANSFLRFDLTEEKIFTLSESSKNIARKLDDRINAKVFVSSEIPPQIKSVFTELRDKINEYKAFSDGNLNLEIVEIGDDEDLKQDAEKNGITPFGISVLENDSRTQKIVYLGAMFRFADRKEVLPAVLSTRNLEYEISRAIKKLTDPDIDKKNIAFSAGHEEPDLFEDLRVVSSVLKEEVGFPRTFDFSSENNTEIPEDIKTLIISSPKKAFTDYEKYLLDQFLMQGKSVLFLLDAIDANLQENRAASQELGLYDLLESYGLELHRNLLLDESSVPVSTVRQNGMFQISEQHFYPLLPRFVSFNENSVITKNLEGLVFSFVSQIEIKEKEGLNIEKLIETTPSSWKMEEPFNISPINNPNFEEKAEGPFIVAAQVDGSFKSFFAGKEIPKNKKRESEEEEKEGEKEKKEEEKDLPQADPEKRLDESKEGARIILISDGEFIHDNYIATRAGADPEKVALFMNSVDWLMQDYDLISIRAREISDRPMKTTDMSTGEKNTIKYLNWFTLPILLLIFGIFNWQFRKREKQFKLSNNED